ncbi:hypothetical protein [Bacillus sp. FJAT-22090]|uniref:hypothetical protein n=1 Tax=Bacillus sp. FJAT-22090 TaxID=1581038 RepID=UPI00119CC571|nr:hypothetical protein [Bacillus sp. FJAT-22090]
MNMLEQYIQEIHSVEPHTADWTKEYCESFVEVTMTTECYGVVENKKRVFGVVEWERVKAQGYYMA